MVFGIHNDEQTYALSPPGRSRARISGTLRSAAYALALVGVAGVPAACGSKQAKRQAVGGIGQPCRPDNSCDAGLQCVNGTCFSAANVGRGDAGMLSFDDQGTTPHSDQGVNVHVPDGGLFDDDAHVDSDARQAQDAEPLPRCGGEPPTQGPNRDCLRPVCNKGAWDYEIVNEGGPCDDGEPCTHSEFCSAGTCKVTWVEASCAGNPSACCNRREPDHACGTPLKCNNSPTCVKDDPKETTLNKPCDDGNECSPSSVCDGRGLGAASCKPSTIVKQRPCPWPYGTATKNQGECYTGTQVCSNNHFASCQGQIAPHDEICFNGKDEDCNKVNDAPNCDTVDIHLWTLVKRDVQNPTANDIADYAISTAPQSARTPHPSIAVELKLSGLWYDWHYGGVAFKLFKQWIHGRRPVYLCSWDGNTQNRYAALGPEAADTLTNTSANHPCSKGNGRALGRLGYLATSATHSNKLGALYMCYRRFGSLFDDHRIMLGRAWCDDPANSHDDGTVQLGFAIKP